MRLLFLSKEVDIKQCQIYTKNYVYKILCERGGGANLTLCDTKFCLLHLVLIIEIES